MDKDVVNMASPEFQACRVRVKKKLIRDEVWATVFILVAILAMGAVVIAANCILPRSAFDVLGQIYAALSALWIPTIVAGLAVLWAVGYLAYSAFKWYRHLLRRAWDNCLLIYPSMDHNSKVFYVLVETEEKRLFNEGLYSALRVVVGIAVLVVAIIGSGLFCRDVLGFSDDASEIAMVLTMLLYIVVVTAIHFFYDVPRRADEICFWKAVKRKSGETKPGK